MSEAKAARICENIFDVIMQTAFHDEARAALTKDLQGHNVSVDKGAGLITIEDSNGKRTLYTIHISKA